MYMKYYIRYIRLLFIIHTLHSVYELNFQQFSKLHTDEMNYFSSPVIDRNLHQCAFTVANVLFLSGFFVSLYMAVCLRVSLIYTSTEKEKGGGRDSTRQKQHALWFPLSHFSTGLPEMTKELVGGGVIRHFCACVPVCVYINVLARIVRSDNFHGPHKLID